VLFPMLMKGKFTNKIHGRVELEQWKSQDKVMYIPFIYCNRIDVFICWIQLVTKGNNITKSQTNTRSLI
jgi:hypothetical protein